ncbi:MULTISPECIES: hypothetical protein [unclassified Sphingomonas]|mgnify:CR=1 FL=1|jgi:hypothetical protein|uniref:hypothetical protein n=1 Tax=unclassified Sphingomonas TaxID=196159 RepID=UPI0025ED98A9|nr:MULTISPECIES: hypothetical protein [unclassified Sphingomonas]
MPTSADLVFYRRREQQERELAARARHPEGRCVHLELAGCYARMIEEMEAGPDSGPALHMPLSG